MQKILFISSLYLLIRISLSLQHFSIPFMDFFSTLDIQINMNDSNKFLELNMLADMIWVHYQLKGVSPEEKKIISNPETLTIFNSNIKAKQAESNFAFPNTSISLSNFPFYYVKEKPNGFFDSFPLAHSIRNEKLSPIHYMYNNNFIKKKGFAIDFPHSSLIIGDIPDNVLKDKKYNVNCTVDKNSIFWGCKINKVLFGNFYFDNQYYSYFQSQSNKILVPKAFMKFIVDNFFQDKINNQLCYKDSTFSVSSYFCDKQILKSFPDITFIMGNDTNITFKDNDLFQNSKGNEVKFLLEENKGNDQEWMFGLVFLNKYLTYFDYDTNLITFYNEEPFGIVDIKNQIYGDDKILNIIKVLIGIMITFSFFIISQLYINNIKINNNKFEMIR